MISRCANPACLAEFDHRKGQLFRFPMRSVDRPGNIHSVQHFWLCADCSKLYSLEYIENHGVALKLRAAEPRTAPRHFIAAA
jgi:hypothetical protein